MTAYLNIGSNIGDRYAHIERAVALITAAYPQAQVRRSTWIESAPWGYDSVNRFVNQGIALDFCFYSPDPQEMLQQLQRIEKEIDGGAHRNADGTYHDRAIDIDIIAIDTLRISTPTLTVPHPRAWMRDFVMAPLQELAPESVTRCVAQEAAISQ